MRPVLSRTLSRAKPFFQAAARIHRAVMESTKPDVQRKIHASVIALEIAVMQLVVEMPDSGSPSKTAGLLASFSYD